MSMLYDLRHQQSQRLPDSGGYAESAGHPYLRYRGGCRRQAEAVLNKKETTLAQQKQQAIKDAFQNWVWKDPYRRAELVEKYNELFNSTRPREYDGSHIHFGGMNPEIRLREHQQNAIAHVLYGGNTLLAHE